jgi:serine protease inhibitor ecotin
MLKLTAILFFFHRQVVVKIKLENTTAACWRFEYYVPDEVTLSGLDILINSVGNNG